MKAADDIAVYIWVKPYVRKYLADNFRVGVAGAARVPLIDLRADPLLRRELAESLTATPATTGATPLRPCKVALRISRDTLSRHGGWLTPDGERRLNSLLEDRCKVMLLTYLSTLYAVTGNLTTCIRQFYDSTGYDDDTWPADSIRKIWQRERFLPKETLSAVLTEKLSTFILEKLSRNGTITKQALTTYENHQL